MTAAAQANDRRRGRGAPPISSAARQARSALARLFARCNAVEAERGLDVAGGAGATAVAELAALREASLAALDERLRDPPQPPLPHSGSKDGVNALQAFRR